MKDYIKLPILCFFLVMAVAGPARAEETVIKEPVIRHFSVRGMGLRTNQRLQRTLQILAGDNRDAAFYRDVFINDAVEILFDYMNRHGYLQPKVRVRALTKEGVKSVYEWNGTFETNVPRSAAFDRVRFSLIPGRRFHYEQIGIAGLSDSQGRVLLTEKEAEGFFFADSFFYRSSRRRLYTPDLFREGMRNLQEALRHRGYRDASVSGEEVHRDAKSGEVRVVVNIESGDRYRVRRLTTCVVGPEGQDALVVSVEEPLQPWSRFWEQDTLLRIRNDYYSHGYADVQCALSVNDIEDSPSGRLADLTVSVRTGLMQRVGVVRFEGRRHTREKSMRRRLSISPGDPLNPLRVEKSRQRLASMGSFDRVSVNTLPATNETRELVYSVEEGKRFEANLLAGYGSYELFRGGLEVEQFNLLGRGHRSRLMLVQSFKSTQTAYVYSIPEILGDRLSGFASLTALRRQEIDFLRREAGAEVGIRRFIPEWDVDSSLRYGYSFLESQQLEAAGEVGIAKADVGSLSADVSRDWRDNPVVPEGGGRIFSRIELAAKVLGGEAEYVLWEMGGALHRRIGGGRTWHGGLHHGLVKALGDEVDKLPFNKRFFPGGDRSLRGYRYGQAASLNAEGQLIGSSFYGLLQNEIEQELTRSLSVVVFVDLLQIGVDLKEYPQGDLLISVGTGLRYQTIVGPLRLEYGHNVRRRDGDPPGTLLFSIGFPF